MCSKSINGENLSFRQLIIPNFQKSDFPPDLWDAPPPPADTHQLSSGLRTMSDRTRPLLQSSLLCCCVRPYQLFSLRLGLWPSHSGPGRAQNWTKTKISIYQNIIFLWAKSKDHYIGHHVSEFVWMKNYRFSRSIS